ncbi:MAG: hypothetical protein ACRDGQ_05595, partial [Candidatus Limnocylindrales bacterium]
MAVLGGAVRRPAGASLILASVLIAAGLLLPLAVMFGQALGSATEVNRVLLRERSLVLLVHTVVLVVLVVLAAGSLGLAAAWFTERSRLPG